MAKGAILYQDRTPAAAITGSTTVAGLDFSQLKDVQPRHRARVNASSAFVILDLLASYSLDVAALVSTSLDSAATARLRMSTSDATVTGSLAYDSGVLSSVSDIAWNGQVIGCLSVPVTARYIRWDLTQSGAPIDIGLAPCGLLWRPARNFGFGGQEGRSDASQRDVNPDTGAEFGLALAQKRCKQLTFPAFTLSEVRVNLDAMDRLVGAAGDILFVEDSDASWADRARDGIWGSYRTPGGAAFAQRQFANVVGRSISLTERL